MKDDEKAMVPGRRMGPKQADTVKAPFGAGAPGVTPFVASGIGVSLYASASGVAPFGAGASSVALFGAGTPGVAPFGPRDSYVGMVVQILHMPANEQVFEAASPMFFSDGDWPSSGHERPEY